MGSLPELAIVVTIIALAGLYLGRRFLRKRKASAQGQPACGKGACGCPTHNFKLPSNK